MEYAEEGDIPNGNNEYAVGNDGNDKPLAEGNNDNNNEYAKDGNITDDDNEYTVGDEGVGEPLAEGNKEYDTLSAARAPACPESKRASVPSH